MLLYFGSDALIDFDGEDNNTKVTRFANYLRLILPGSDGATMVLAAKSLGALAIRQSKSVALSVTNLVFDGGPSWF